jgi:hypothetical protein
VPRWIKHFLGVLTKLAERLPAMLIDSLPELWNELDRLDKQIADIERRLDVCRRG